MKDNKTLVKLGYFFDNDSKEKRYRIEIVGRRYEEKDDSSFGPGTGEGQDGYGLLEPWQQQHPRPATSPTSDWNT